MESRTFGSPVPWGLGSGPTLLYSVDGAIAAAQIWLELTPQLRATEHERKWMLALLDLLQELPPNPSDAEMDTARMAIEGIVEYSTSPVAERQRLSTYSRLAPAA